MGFLHPENSTGVIDAPSSLSTFTFVQKVSEKKKRMVEQRTHFPVVFLSCITIPCVLRVQYQKQAKATSTQHW